jgi:DNA primase
VAALPDGDDPDTFALREGTNAVEELVGRAPGLSTHLLERALPKGRASLFEEKMAALARFRPLLEAMPPGMARTLFMSQLADHLGVAESDVRSSLRQEIKPRPSAGANQKVPPPPVLDVHEELFAALLIADTALREEPDARFRDEIRAIEVRVLLESDRPGDGLSALSEPARKGIERRLKEISETMALPDARKKALRDASIKVRLARLEEERVEKKRELDQSLSAGASEDEIIRLQGEHKQLCSQRERLKQRCADVVPALAKGSA